MKEMLEVEKGERRSGPGHHAWFQVARASIFGLMSTFALKAARGIRLLSHRRDALHLVHEKSGMRIKGELYVCLR
jgi:hypothetical protein